MAFQQQLLANLFPYLKEDDDTPQVDLHSLTGGAVAPAATPDPSHQPAPAQSVASVAGPPTPPASQQSAPVQGGDFGPGSGSSLDLYRQAAGQDNAPIQTLGGMQQPEDTNAVYNRIDNNAPSVPPQQPAAVQGPPMQQQAMTALSSPKMTAPDNSPKAMKQAEKDAKMPKFTPPYANPQNEAEAAANKEAENTFNIDHPQNKDLGAKGLISELLQNFFYGLAQAKPGMGLGESLALGGVGAGAGFINKGWNERRQAEEAAPRLRQQTQDAERRVGQQSAIDTRNIQTGLQIDKATRDNISARQKPYLDQWDKKPSFDPVSNPEDKAFADEALKNGVRLTAKTPNGRYSTTIDAKSGSVVVTNTQTGDYKVEQGAVPRPAENDTDYNKRYTAWQNEKVKTDRQVSQLVLEGESAQNTAAEWERQAAERLKKDPYDAGALKLKSDAIAKRAEGAAKINRGNEMRSQVAPEPTKPEKSKPYSGVVVTTENWPGIKSKFPGKDDAAIRAIITANGGTFAK